MTKPVLMIHEVSEQLFKLPLEDYILTFDDGLYSQYRYWPQFKALNTKKIFFVSTNIVCTGQQSTEFITCREAHQKAFGGNMENYMTLEQIRELDDDPLTIIGGHSHYHTRLHELKLLDKLKHIKQDTELMQDWFNDKLGHLPTKFCFPYNDNYGGLYNAVLKQYGYQSFYGYERIAVERLLETHSAISV